MRVVWDLIAETFRQWMEDKAQRLGAALAYYAVFSIAPLLVIAVAFLDFIYPGDSLYQVRDQIAVFLGNLPADSIMRTIRSMERIHGTMGTMISVITLIIGSTAAFGQLQDAMNTIWEVAPKPRRVLTEMLRTRLVSFLMILGLCGVMLLSITATTALNIAAHYFEPIAPRDAFIWKLADFMISMVVATALCAFIYKVLPDIQIAWRDVAIGSAATALLFNFGKMVITAYLVHSTFTSAYGTAGSLMVLLAWVYYSAQVLFLGAEFTHVYANRYGSRIRPARGAVFLSEEARIRQGIAHSSTIEEARRRTGTDS